MNIAAIRLNCWLFSMSLTFGLSYYGYEFYRDAESIQLPADEYVRDTLGDTIAVMPARAACIVYPEVDRTWRQHNWTGKKIIHERPGPGLVDEGPQFLSVRSMLRIHMVQVDGADDAAGSCIYVHYLDERIAPGGSGRLGIGASLPTPLEGTSVVSITLQGVEFAHAGFPEQNEIVPVPAPTFVLAPDGARFPAIPRIPPGSESTLLDVKQTRLVGRNRYQVGSDDAAYLADNYPEILTSDMRYRTSRDPQTGKRRGIEIQEVRTGSVPERHGLSQGDIILSVNGEPVTSVQGAISYFKTNADRFTTWEVALENRGRRRTVTYESPAH